MVYLADVLVVMTEGLKIVRICARNVHRAYTTRTQALRRRRVSRVSLSRKATVSRARCAGAPSC